MEPSVASSRFQDRENYGDWKNSPTSSHTPLLQPQGPFGCCRHYVPAVSYAIYQHNKKTKSSDINLKGLAIGNGLTDPAIQYGAYADYALKNDLIPSAVHSAVKAVSPSRDFVMPS